MRTFRLFGRLALAAFATLGGSIGAQAGTLHQTHDSILAAAVAHVHARADRFVVPPQIEPGALDNRLRLARCESPLATYDAPGGIRAGTAVIGVRCNGARPWKLFVPVKISLPAQVVAAARPLRRGEILASEDLVLIDQDLARLHGAYFRDPAQAIGRRVKRTLREREVIPPGAIAVRKLVRRGKEVVIQSGLAGVEVRMRGKAMGDGVRGERIRVKNLSSGRELAATVVGPGLVQVPGLARMK